MDARNSPSEPSVEARHRHGSSFDLAVLRRLRLLLFWYCAKHSISAVDPASLLSFFRRVLTIQVFLEFLEPLAFSIMAFCFVVGSKGERTALLPTVRN
jgi:hypothetical protein